MNPRLQIRGIPPNAVFITLPHTHTHTALQDLITLQPCFLFIAGATSASHVTSDLPGRALQDWGGRLLAVTDTKKMARCNSYLQKTTIMGGGGVLCNLWITMQTQRYTLIRDNEVVKITPALVKFASIYMYSYLYISPYLCCLSSTIMSTPV